MEVIRLDDNYKIQIPFGHVKIVLHLIVVMIVQLCKYTKNYQVNIKWVYCMVHKL